MRKEMVMKTCNKCKRKVLYINVLGECINCRPDPDPTIVKAFKDEMLLSIAINKADED